MSYTLEELAAAWNTHHPTDLLTLGTVKHYREELLLEGPHRTPQGRRYTRQHLEQIRLIRLMKQNGFTAEEIVARMWNLEGKEIKPALQFQEHIRALHEQALGKTVSAQTGLSEPVPETEPEVTLESENRVDWEKNIWFKVRIADGIEVFINTSLVWRHKAGLEAWLRQGLALTSPQKAP